MEIRMNSTQECIIIGQAFNKAIDTLLVTRPQLVDRGDAELSLTRVNKFLNEVRKLTILYASELKDLETCPIAELKNLINETNGK